MNDLVKAAIAERCNRLEFVRWDRCVVHDTSAAVFGWIDRLDGHSDFVVLDFSWGETLLLSTGKEDTWLAVGLSTSSAKHSMEISDLLELGPGHKDCERVSAVLDGVVRTVGR